MAKEKVLKITGMDCADCAVQIEGAVSRIKGVKSAKVYLGSSTLAVIPETEGLDMNVVAKEVKKLGYGVVDEEGSGKITLYVEGMDCADTTLHFLLTLVPLYYLTLPSNPSTLYYLTLPSNPSTPVQPYISF